MSSEKDFSSLDDLIGECSPSGLVALDRGLACAMDWRPAEDHEDVAVILRFARLRLDIAQYASTLYGVDEFVADQDRAGVVPLLRFGVDAPVVPAAPAVDTGGLSFRAVLSGLPVRSVALIGLALRHSGLVSAGGVVDRAWAEVGLFDVDQGVVDILDYEFGGEDGLGVSAALDRAVGGVS